MSRYIAVETDFMSEWLVVDTQYPTKTWRGEETSVHAKVVQQGLREDFAKTLVKSLNKET